MKEALKAETIPYLRSLGFKGSMPDFYRPKDDHTECLQFYFKRDSEDDRFFVQAGRASNLGVDWHRPVHHTVPPSKVHVTQLKGAIRLGAKVGSNDHWFDFSRTPVEAVAREVLTLLAANDYWERLKEVPITTQGKNYR
jgi:hypothetical protein